jgi:hypothetical protein
MRLDLVCKFRIQSLMVGIPPLVHLVHLILVRLSILTTIPGQDGRVVMKQETQEHNNVR